MTSQQQQQQQQQQSNQPKASPSLPEIAMMKGHQNAECASKCLAASMARLQLGTMFVDCYVAAVDPSRPEPPPAGLAHHPAYLLAQQQQQQQIAQPRR